MISALISAHAELEKEIESAIKADSDSHELDSLDARRTQLESAIRKAVPINDDQARQKLDFFLERVETDGEVKASKHDMRTLRELFQHILDHKDCGLGPNIANEHPMTARYKN